MQSFPASGDPTELQAPRNKEAEVFGFIEKEMTDAIAVMATAPTEYRLNKWSALAFKSRAMLHAAAIAHYGEVQLDGLVGIPATEATHYWESAREAAKQVIAGGQYELLCVKPGKGSLSVDGVPLVVKDAKPLPASD